MASSDLTWTEAESPVNQIAEYRIYKSTNVLPSAAGFNDSFVLLDTLPVVRDPEFPFGEVHPTSYSDTAVDFSTNFYCYRIDAVSVLVGEATGGSPQTGVGPSNVECVGTSADPATLSGVKIDQTQIDLSWVNGSAGVNPIFSTCVYRSVDGGPFTLLVEVFEPTTTYDDTSVNLDDHTYDYYVITKDEAGIESDPSNTVSFGFSVDIAIAISSSQTSGFNRLMVSTDGITWEGRQIADNLWQDLVFLDDVGQSGRILALNDNPDDAVWYSDDGGRTFTPGVTPAVVDGWIRFAYSSALGRSVAISNDVSTNGNKVMTSDDDGETWTLRSTPVSMDSLNWGAIIWDPASALFIAGNLSGAGVDKIATSADGITWTHITTPQGNGDGVGDDFAIDSSSGRFVGANRGNNSNFWSDDPGVTWNNAGVPNGWAGGATSIAFGAGLFVALGGGSTAVETSPDGSGTGGGVWTNRPLGGPSGGWEEIVYHEPFGLFIALAGTGTPDKIITSPDGITWTARTEPADTNARWSAIIAAKKPANETLQDMVMVEFTGLGNEAAISQDGQSWTVNATGIDLFCNDVAWDPVAGLYATVGNDFVYTSPDGIVWTSRTPSTATLDWETIVYLSEVGLLIKGAGAVPGTQGIATSADGGITWVAQTTPNNTEANDFCVLPTAAAGGNPRIVMVGLNGFTNPTGNYLYSDDSGVTWQVSSNNPSNVVGCCVYDSTRDRVCSVQNLGLCNVSGDGDTYTLNINSGDIGSTLARSLAYSANDDTLVLAAANGLWSSIDGGANWVQQDVNDWNDVEYSTVLGKFFAINSGAPRLLSSTDGITWVTEPDPAGVNGAWSAIALGDQI